MTLISSNSGYYCDQISYSSDKPENKHELEQPEISSKGCETQCISTDFDTEVVPISPGGLELQCCPELIELESKVLRMLHDINSDEVRIPLKRINTKSRKLILSNMVKAHDLSSFKFQDDNSEEYMVVRKKPKFKRKQLLEYEENLKKKMEKKQQVVLLKQDSTPKMVSSSCQFNHEEENEKTHKRNRQRRRQEIRNRIAQETLERELKEKEVIFVTSCMQTCAEDEYVCLYCGNNILLSEKVIHSSMCKSNQRYMTQLKKTNKKILSKEQESSFPVVIAIKGKKTKEDKQKVKIVTKEKVVLDKIDNISNNDINALTNALKKLCSFNKCTNKLDGKCKVCQRNFCSEHLNLEKKCSSCHEKDREPTDFEQKYQVYQGQLREAMRNRIKNLERRRR